MHKKQQAEFIVKKFPIHSKDKIEVLDRYKEVNKKQISNPHRETD